MWKTITLELGKELELDSPNEGATVKVVPMAWLPGKTNQEIMRRSQDDEIKIASIPDTDTAATINIRMETLYATMPHFVVDWTLKDPDSGQPILSPRAMLAAGDVSMLAELPAQMLSYIFNKAMEYGMEQEDLARLEPGQPDPDAGNEAAQAIPFENANVSEQPSLMVVAPQP